MSWIKLPLDFGMPMGRLVIDARDVIGTSITDRFHGEPAGMVAFLAALIAAERPDLAGGSVLGINLDYSSMSWEVLYTHPSLPKNELGQMIQRVPFKLGEADLPTEVVG